MLPANYTKAHAAHTHPSLPPSHPCSTTPFLPLPLPPSPGHPPRPRWTSSRDHPNIWSGIIAMQWTEYCQNLSAAVFHAPRQMSRAIKARELAPRKFSSAVARQGTNGTGEGRRGANNKRSPIPRISPPPPLLVRLGEGRRRRDSLLPLLSHFLFPPVFDSSQQGKVFDYSRMFDVPGIGR